MRLEVNIEKELADFSLQVSFAADNKPLGIIGGSGAGKSMTLRCIAGLDTPTRGQIVLNHKVIFDSEKRLNLPTRQRSIGFLFQNYALFPHMTVFQNICFGLQRLTKSERFARAKTKIAMTRLEGLEERYPFQLSGGQQQRVALARALIMDPEVLLLDEPFSALDNYLRDQMQKELMEILAEYTGVTLFVTHNLEESYRICQDLLILDHGRKVAYGPKDDIFQRPPTLSAAHITGCTNLSRARLVSNDSVEALDWGCSLKFDRPLSPPLTHVGIRAHHLAIVGDSSSANVFPCWLARVNESPHQMSLYLSLDAAQQIGTDHHLQVEVFKEQWESMKNSPFPWYVHLDPKFLFLTNE